MVYFIILRVHHQGILYFITFDMSMLFIYVWILLQMMNKWINSMCFFIIIRCSLFITFDTVNLDFTRLKGPKKLFVRTPLLKTILKDCIDF